MPEFGQGRMGTLFILIMSLFVLLLVMAHSLYSLKTRNQTAKAPRETQITIEKNDENILSSIKRIRNSLVKYLPGRRESSKFRAVFDGLELAALREKINIVIIAEFSDSLKNSLNDNMIDEREMEVLLEILESSIMN